MKDEADTGTGRHGDAGTRGRGDTAKDGPYAKHPRVAPSPCLRVFLVSVPS